MLDRGDLGRELRALRIARGLSLIEAARRAAVSRGSLHRWEAGEQKPGGKALAGLLAVLGAEPREQALLLTGATSEPTLVGVAASPLGAPVHPGYVLRSLRESHGMTQSALAAAVGVGQPTVAKWEAGRAMPGKTSLARAAALLGAEDLGLRPESLDLYEPIVDPHDARLRLRDPVIDIHHPLGAARLLAIEREIWPLAAKDARWEETLAEALSYRSVAYLKWGNYTSALATAGRAIRLAQSGGWWDAVGLAVLTTMLIRANRGASEAVLGPQWLRLVERTRDPFVKSLYLREGSLCAAYVGDRKTVDRFFPQSVELVSNHEPTDLFGEMNEYSVASTEYLPRFDFRRAFHLKEFDQAFEILTSYTASDLDHQLRPTESDTVYWYIRIHETVGQTIPEAALKILDANARAAATWETMDFYHWHGPKLGIYTPPTWDPK